MSSLLLMFTIYTEILTDQTNPHHVRMVPGQVGDCLILVSRVQIEVLEVELDLLLSAGASLVGHHVEAEEDADHEAVQGDRDKTHSENIAENTTITKSHSYTS